MIPLLRRSMEMENLNWLLNILISFKSGMWIKINLTKQHWSNHFLLLSSSCSFLFLFCFTSYRFQVLPFIGYLNYSCYFLTVVCLLLWIGRDWLYLLLYSFFYLLLQQIFMWSINFPDKLEVFYSCYLCN